MAEKGRITEDRLVEGSVYQIGKKISDTLKEGNVAVNDINKDLKAFADNLEYIKKFALEFGNLQKLYKNTSSWKEFLENRRKEKELTEQNITAYKEQQRLEGNLIKTIERKKLAVESTNKSLIKNRFELQQLNKLEKENAILNSRSATFMQKLNVRRAKAIRIIQDLNAKKELGIKLSNKEQRELRQSQREFQKYNKAITVAKRSTGQFQENVGNYPKIMQPAIGAFKNLIPMLGAGFGLKTAWDFSMDLYNTAREAKGVEFAFQNIGVEAQIAFDKVKKSTRGLVSDLEIKTAIVDFDNFNLSLDEMNTLMEFAAVRSTQTGKSMDYMLDSLKEGLSKESLLRLDNLGISMTDMRREMDEFGLSVTEAFTKLAGQEIQEAGPILDEAADAQQRFNAQLENFKVSAGSGFIKNFVDGIYDLGSAMVSVVKDANDASGGSFFGFMKNLFSMTQAGGMVMMQTEAAIQRDLNARKPLVEEILKIEKEQGVIETQRILNKDKYLKMNSEELKLLLQKMQVKEKETETEKELTEEEKKALEERLKRERKATYELSKFRIEQAVKTKDKIINNEDILGIERIRAVQEREALQIELAELTKEHLLSNATLTSQERILIEEQTAAKIGEIYTKTFADIDTIGEQVRNQLFGQDTSQMDIEGGSDDDQALFEQGLNDLKEKYKAFTDAIGVDEDEMLAEMVANYGDNFNQIYEHYEKLDEVAKKSTETRRDLEQQLANASIEFVNTLFDRKIVSIQDEIAANDEKYDRLFNLAAGDKDQQDKLRAEQDLKRRELEKKQKEEERKQAIFNKLLAVADIGIALARTIANINAAAAAIDILTFGKGGTPYRVANIPFAIATAAFQVATVLATPIPRYEKGTKFKPTDGVALVGEVRPEVITEPNKEPYIVSKPTFLDLPKGTRVTPSLEEYERLMRLSNLTSLEMNKKQADSYLEAKETFSQMELRELILETKKNTEILKKKKLSVNIKKQQTDINHEIFRFKTTNWDA